MEYSIFHRTLELFKANDKRRPPKNGRQKEHKQKIALSTLLGASIDADIPWNNWNSLPLDERDTDFPQINIFYSQRYIVCHNFYSLEMRLANAYGNNQPRMLSFPSNTLKFLKWILYYIAGCLRATSNDEPYSQN